MARYGRSGLTLDGTILLHGMPTIELVAGGTIRIAEGATLNSDPANYHASMHSPVRLIVSRSGARIEIGRESRVHGSCVHARSGVYIGARCLIAANCQILDSSGHDASFPDVTQRICTTDEPRAIHIEDDVWLGLNVIVLPGVRIGRGCIVAAGSVVAHSLPPMTLCSGVPAVPVRDYRPPVHP
ncbi:MAG TPA: acyltransferase [Polyangiaceae bacterium]|nr:acyltransferase [Polyangiaceae bacterium]